MMYTKDNKIYAKVTYVVIDDRQIINPTHEQILSAGYEVYNEPVEPELTDEQKLEYAKYSKRIDIETYDKSSNVNEFSFNGVAMWLDFSKRKDMRVGLDSKIALGKGDEDYNLWYNDTLVGSASVNVVSAMLYALEDYALECYDVTHSHIASVNALTTIEDVEQYNYTTGYPSKLSF